MTASVRFSLLTISWIVLSLFVFSAIAQEKQVAAPSAAALAMELRSGDTDRIAEAVSYLPWDWTKEESERIAEFRQGVSSLVAEGLIVALGDQADQFIALDEGHEDAHSMIDLLDSMLPMVAVLEDERAIPALLKATQFGNTAANGLASFGPHIFPVIFDYIESPERIVEELDGALFALVRTVERWRPLEIETHATLRQLAIDYIRGYVPEHLTDDPVAYILERTAMYLASSLGDADLKPMVAARASKHPGFVETYLERWYDGPSGAVQQDQIAPND